ncbi:hypothetical protein CFC21_014191 [Triticum aestivum]|uniref:Uncharacterized protein n=2 Tax=Triticum aestivum TaxID=4565 RepID=A0A3B6A3J3_WHEAT|nr:uncharacterized protein LOC123183373 isoform X2 [Triticum aestivum]KAF6998032.1 hypothetical protein CFC21_014191 [Triticum aestivum]
MATPCGWVICPWPSVAWVSWCLLGPLLYFLVVSCLSYIRRTFGVRRSSPLYKQIFDVTLNEKLGYMEDALLGFLAAISFGIVPDDAPSKSCAQDLLSFLLFFSVILLVLVQVMVLAIILSPLAIIYVLGIFMSGVISWWRLIEHDHGGNSDEKASNLAPALQILYYLALLQGVLFCYRFLLTLTEKKFSKTLVTEDSMATEDSEVQAVLYNYLRKTRRGCEKDPTFTQGRNLVTHAVDKIGSNSPVDCISGVKILYAAICMVERKNDWSNVHGQRMLIKHLVLSTSSSRHVLPKLLEMLDSRGLHDRKGRIQAAMIVERLAFYINLEQFPRSIQHISSLIGTFEQYSIAEPYPRSRDGYEQHLKLQVTRRRPSPAGELGKAYKELLLQGLSILRNLAADENNCRIMSDTRDLVCKIMAPVTCDLLDHTADDHGTWCEVVGRSMEVMSHLSGAQGETGAKLRREISSCAETIGTLLRILSCKNCKEELRQRAIWILARLYMDTNGINRSAGFHLLKNENSCCGEDFVGMLVNIFTRDNEYSSSIRGYAGEALSNICSLGGISDATTIIQTSGDVVDSLTQVLLHEENETCRQASAEILERLCTHYTKDDEYLHKLKKAILKVIGKILSCGDGTHNGEDIESQCDGTQENNEPDKDAQGFQVDTLSTMSSNLLSSLLCLCGAVYNTPLVVDLPPQLDASSFLNNLRDMVVKRSGPTVENLSVCKAAGNMVISMLKYYSGGFFKQEHFGSLIEALSSASENMLDLDYSVVCSSASSSEARSKLDRRTLVSLVREAKELHAMAPSTSLSG